MTPYALLLIAATSTSPSSPANRAAQDAAIVEQRESTNCQSAAGKDYKKLARCRGFANEEQARALLACQDAAEAARRYGLELEQATMKLPGVKDPVTCSYEH